MENSYGNAYGAGALAQSAANLRNSIQAAPAPSLEDRLEHLQRGCERLSKLRSHLNILADRISLIAETGSATSGATPTPSDLSGKFGDAINYAHNNLDEIERLVHRIDAALFSGNRVTAAKGLG